MNEMNFTEDPSQTFDMPQEATGAQGSFVVYPQDNTDVINPMVAEARAEKYSFGLGATSPGKEAIHQALVSGNERYIRLKAISDESLRHERIKQVVAEDIVRGKGGDLTEEEREVVRNLTKAETAALSENPDIILEKLYATKLVDTAGSTSPHSHFMRLSTENPEEADRLHGVGSRIIATQEATKKLLSEVEGRWEQAGVGATISNYAELVVPGFTWYNVQNALKNAPTVSFLPGNNIEEQIRHLYTLPPGQAIAELKSAIEVMERANPLDAINFLKAMTAYTSTGQFVDNLMGVLDLSTPVPVGAIIHPLKAGKQVITTAGATAKALADVVKVSSKPSVKAAEVLEAAGDYTLTARAHLEKALAGASEKAANQGQQATWDDFMGSLPMLTNPKAWLEGGELAKSAPFLAKVTQELEASSAKMIDGVLVQPINIHRIQPGTPAFQAAIDDAIERVAKQRPHVADNLIYAAPNTPALSDNTLSGVNYIDLHYGMNGGKPFEREIEAQWRINQWKLADAEVVPEGNGFAVRVRVAIDEASPKVRSLLHKTEAATPTGMDKLFFSWARSPNDLLSADVVRDRGVATYGMSQMTEMARGLITEVKGALSKKSWEDLGLFAAKQRDYMSPEGVRGRFSANLAEFEMDWQAQFGRLPSEAEVTAYTRYMQVSNMDLAVRSLLNHKNKASLGIQTVQLPYHNTFDDVARGIKIEGRLASENPFDSAEAFSFLIWDSNPQMLKDPMNWHVNSSRVARPKMEERIAKEGLVPIQLTKAGEAMLRSDPRYAKMIPDSKIDYIYVKQPRMFPLPINQVPDRPGGHVKLKDGVYLSQPNISQRTVKGNEHHYYHGDINLAHFVREADARALLPQFEEARKLLQEAWASPTKDLSKVSRYLSDNLPGLFKSVDDFTKMFKGADSFSVNRSFTIRPTGKSVNDVENLSTQYSNFRMGGDDVHNPTLLRQDPNYLKERGDIFPTIAWHGSDDAPKLTFTGAELVDPMQTMESAFQSIIRSRYLDDLRIKVTERFINEFQNILDVPVEQLRTNPWAHLLEPTFKQGASPEHVQAARNLRRTMLEFLNIQTPLEREIGYVKQKLADSVYSTVGKDGMAKLEAGKEILDRVSFGATKDPIRFMRSLAFHEKLGLYNVKQLFLQAQSLTNILSIEGTHGLKAMGAYMFHRGMLQNSNKEVVEGLAKAATGMGWKKEELLESWQAAERSGFFRVGGEVAYLDEMATPSLITTTAGRLIDSAAIFFREGERVSRITAWNAAYLRWKSLNPGKPLTDLEMGKILDRADILNGNMSRASNAQWQQGIFSIPTQFWGYQARLSELMIGKRLTLNEKARLVTGYSLMYGLPTGFAATGAGMLWPWQEAVRKYQIENGGAYDEGVVNRIMTEGFGGIAAGVIFGEPVNFSEQYSPQGLSVVKDLLDPDKGILKLLMGVSGTVMVDNIKATKPFGMALLKTVGVDGGYDLTPRDWSDALSVVSSFSNLAKAYHAYANQEYWSKKEAKLSTGEVSQAQAVIMGTTGLVPKKITDAYLMASSMKDRKAAQEEIRTEAIKNLRLGFKADGVDEADKYFRRAQIHMSSGQFTPNELRQILNQAARGGAENFVDAIALKYALTKPERMQDLLRKGDR